MQTVEISYIVPAYNDQEVLESKVNDVLKQLPRRYTSYEVVIVNDGSLDGTGQIADQLAASNPAEVRVIHMSTNHGFEAAIKTGAHAAKGEHILFTPPPH